MKQHFREPVSRSVSKKIHRMVILWWVCQKTSNFYQIILLIVAFKNLYCQIYCCFHVLVIKLIQAIFTEMKQQLQRPVISTIVDSYTSVSQQRKVFAQAFDSLKIKNVSNFYFEERTVKKAQTFYFFKGPLFRNGSLY